MATPVFLAHSDPAGAETHIPLHQDRNAAISTYYLSDVASKPLSISPTEDSEHASIRIDIEQEYYLLSVYKDQLEPVVVLGHCRLEMPVSTATHQKSIILTEEHHFLTASGRWRVVWDRSGTISQSMQAPPLPTVNQGNVENHPNDLELLAVGDGGALVDQDNVNSLFDNTKVPVTNIDLPDADRTAIDEDEPTHEAESVLADSVSTKSVDIDGPENPSVQESRSSITAAYDLTTDTEKHDVHLPTLDNQPAVPQEPVSEREEDSISDQNSEGTVHGTEIMHDAHGQHETSDLETKIATSRTSVESQTVVRLADCLPPQIQKPDEYLTNVDEGQQYEKPRTKRRKLSDIEFETDQVQCKRSKSGGVDNQSTEQLDSSVAEEADDTIIVALRTPKGSHSVKRKPVKKPVSHGKKQRRPTVKLPAKDRPRSESPAKPTTVSFTPARRSSRRRSTPSSASDPHELDYDNPKIIFSSTSKLSTDKGMKSTIEKLGGVVVTDVNEADVLCVGDVGLKKTSKFVIAVAKGKDIVTDEWLQQARIDQKFPACQGFLPRDSKHETEWGFSLPEALERGKQGLKFLEDTHVYLTAQLRKDLGNLVKDLKLVGLALGAAGVRYGLPAKDTKSKVLVVGSVRNVDPECYKVKQLGHKLYSQDVLTMAAIRGQLEIDSEEFVISPPIKEEQLSQ